MGIELKSLNFKLRMIPITSNAFPNKASFKEFIIWKKRNLSKDYQKDKHPT